MNKIFFNIDVEDQLSEIIDDIRNKYPGGCSGLDCLNCEYSGRTTEQKITCWILKGLSEEF